MSARVLEQAQDAPDPPSCDLPPVSAIAEAGERAVLDHLARSARELVRRVADGGPHAAEGVAMRPVASNLTPSGAALEAAFVWGGAGADGRSDYRAVPSTLVHADGPADCANARPVGRADGKKKTIMSFCTASRYTAAGHPLRHATPCRIMSSPVMSCHAVPYHVISYYIMACHAMPCHAMPYDDLHL